MLGADEDHHFESFSPAHWVGEMNFLTVGEREAYLGIMSVKVDSGYYELRTIHGFGHYKHDGERVESFEQAKQEMERLDQELDELVTAFMQLEDNDPAE